VLLGTAAAGVLDYLMKWQVTEHLGRGPHLLRFFALFYGSIQIATLAAQAASARTLQRLGVGRTIFTLPAGVGLVSGIALLVPVLPVIVAARGVEAVLRGSLFRNAYELLFVPMDTAERRRVKTFLDVTCDRAGRRSARPSCRSTAHESRIPERRAAGRWRSRWPHRHQWLGRASRLYPPSSQHFERVSPADRRRRAGSVDAMKSTSTSTNRSGASQCG
jgi:hypothetical protein